MTPRMMTAWGMLLRNVCPYCGTTYRNFLLRSWVVKLLLVLTAVILVLPRLVGGLQLLWHLARR